MSTERSTSQPVTPGAKSDTWNTPEQIAAHRAMTPGQRVRRTIEVSRAALLFTRAERVDDR